ncbi:MAG: Hpt domain-containing protein [Planctomycetota bacterium]|jgi:HPt (histidine-containing phosphotransfer) domain-containing protein|nr:Hpt domain-containing protein [Planctomycetota bacterium]
MSDATSEELDRSMLAEIRDMSTPDDDLFGEIIDTYLDDVPKRIAGLHEAIAAGDADKIHRAAHTMKGSSSNLGLLGMVAACQAVVNAGRSGQLDGVEAKAAALDQAFARAREILNQERAE